MWLQVTEDAPEDMENLNTFWGTLGQLVILPIGWVYLAIPLFWMRKRMQQADLPELQRKGLVLESQQSAGGGGRLEDGLVLAGVGGSGTAMVDMGAESAAPQFETGSI